MNISSLPKSASAATFYSNVKEFVILMVSALLSVVTSTILPDVPSGSATPRDERLITIGLQTAVCIMNAEQIRQKKVVYHIFYLK